MKYASINQLFTIIGGNPAPKGDDAFNSNGLPFVKMKDLGRAHFSNNLIEIENRISYEKAEELNLKIIKKGSILLPRSGSVALNHRAILGVDAYMVSHICALEIIDNSIINNVYAYYYLRTISMDRITKKTTGLDAITFEDLAKIRIPIPPLKDQMHIAAILVRSEKLIAKRKESIKALDEFLKSTFLEMFGDPVRNEKGWVTYSGNDYSDLLTVGVVIRPASYYTEKGIIALRSLNIKPNRIDLNNLVFFSEESSNGVLSKSILKEGDVLIVRTGVTGTAAVVPKELDGVNCIDLIIVRPKKDMLNPYYLAFLLNSERGKRLVTSKEVGGIQKHFNIGAIKDISFPFPPVTLQNKFAAIVAKVELMKVKYNESLIEMEKLYGSLSQRAFRGEL